MDNVKIPWAKVVKAMGGETTVSATIQHLTKLRKRLAERGHDVPPPPRRGGTDRVNFGSWTSVSEKEGDSYDSDGEEAFKVEEDFGMARGKRAKREAKDDYGDRLKIPASDDGRFARRNLELWEGDECSMSSTLTLRNFSTEWIIETLLDYRQHSEFEPSLEGGFNPPIYNMDQIGGFFDQAPKHRAFGLAPDAACTSRNIADFYPTLEFDRVPSVPEPIANSTGRYETLLTDHRLVSEDLDVYDFAEKPSFGRKVESQATYTHASQEPTGADSVTITGTPSSDMNGQARVQSLTTQETTSSNAEWLGDTFSGGMDELDMGDEDALAHAYIVT